MLARGETDASWRAFHGRLNSRRDRLEPAACAAPGSTASARRATDAALVSPAQAQPCPATFVAPSWAGIYKGGCPSPHLLWLINIADTTDKPQWKVLHIPLTQGVTVISNRPSRWQTHHRGPAVQMERTEFKTLIQQDGSGRVVLVPPGWVAAIKVASPDLKSDVTPDISYRATLENYGAMYGSKLVGAAKEHVEEALIKAAAKTLSPEAYQQYQLSRCVYIVPGVVQVVSDGSLSRETAGEIVECFDALHEAWEKYREDKDGRTGSPRRRA